MGMREIREELIIVHRRPIIKAGYLEKATSFAKQHALPMRELMTCYKCALMEIETKFKVLNEEFSIDGETNPVESIKSRIKSPESIMEKLVRKGHPISLESVEQHLNDVAGIRVVCSLESDVYMLAEALLRQDDVRLIERKDYIANPKENGYRSLHLIVSTPVHFHDHTKWMKVEVQLRTLAMDVWASLEHKICYKKDHESLPSNASEELLECARLSAEIDARMQALKDATAR